MAYHSGEIEHITGKFANLVTVKEDFGAVMDVLKGRLDTRRRDDCNT